VKQIDFLTTVGAFMREEWLELPLNARAESERQAIEKPTQASKILSFTAFSEKLRQQASQTDKHGLINEIIASSRNIDW